METDVLMVPLLFISLHSLSHFELQLWPGLCKALGIQEDIFLKLVSHHSYFPDSFLGLTRIRIECLQPYLAAPGLLRQFGSEGNILPRGVVVASRYPNSEELLLEM